MTRKEFASSEKKQFYSYCVLALLMLIQISSLWSKFIIGAAYNYQGDHSGDSKFDIQEAIPDFTYAKYTMVTGVYYSFTYGAAALFAGMISDKYPRKRILFIVCICWNLTSFVNMLA